MGDPKFSRKTYVTPSHPWEGERIKEENELIRKYGLKNKRELWKAHSILKNFRVKARELIARERSGEKQAEIETKQLLDRLVRLGMLPPNSTLDDVLALNVEAVLSRRLQTLTYLKGLAHTPKQARQLVVHGHTSIRGRKVTIPGYLVKKDEEDFISYHESSPLSNELHPARPKPEEGRAEPEKEEPKDVREESKEMEGK